MENNNTSSEKLKSEIRLLCESTESYGVTDALVNALVQVFEQSNRQAVLEALERVKEREWKPAYAPESEEEKGYQKGLMAQISLSNKRIDEAITALREGGK